MRKLASIKGLPKEEWLKLRQRGLGGSDAAAILGLSPYKSAYAVYIDKSAETPEEIPDNEPMRQGRDFEDYVAKRFEGKTGKAVRRCGFLLQHDEHDFILANIDREIVGEKAGLECKTTSVLNLKRFKNGEFPAEYYCQCMHYMAVTGYKKWYLAVLVLNKEFMIFEIPRDEAEIKVLIAAEKEFWEMHVLAKNPPAPDGSERCGELIKEMFPVAEPENDALLFGMEDKARLYKSLDEKIKEQQKILESFKQEFQVALRDCETGSLNGYQVKWKNYTRTSLDTELLKSEEPEIYEQYLKTTKYRKFELKETKEWEA